MSQSPLDERQADVTKSYLAAWDDLSTLIGRGSSFSGRERNCCFLNTGNVDFADVSTAIGLDLIDDGRGLAVTDWDGDGDLDVWLTNRTAPRVRFIRNNYQTPNGFVSLRLQGAQCNRDAIGARVTVHTAEKGSGFFYRTLHAGDGFVSQSSKWLHFGLGETRRISHVEIRWPGSESTETFNDIEPNQAYLIVQGSGTALPVKRRRGVKLMPSDLNIPASTDQARIVLTRRRPAPPLDYLDFHHVTRAVEFNQSNQAVLINLWASWCQPCLAELAELSQYNERLIEQGISVVALSVDAYSGDGATGFDQVRETSDRLGITFPVGLASKETVTRLTQLMHQIVYPQRPLPVPCSFLFDSRRQLVAVYRGPLSAGQLIEDARLMGSDRDAIQQAAFPFPGRDGVELFDIRPYGFAAAYREGGYLTDAMRAVERQLTRTAGLQTTTAEQQRARLEMLLRTYRLKAAIARDQQDARLELDALREVTHLQPESLTARANLAMASWRAGDQAGASALFRQIEQKAPASASVSSVLGQAYLATGQTEKAISSLRRAALLDSSNVRRQFELAVALRRGGQSREAVRLYREILDQAPDRADVLNNLAWILATCSDDAIRDADQAIELARRASRINSGSAEVLDSLSAGYAAKGQFSAATETAQRALRIARARGMEALVNQISDHLATYRQRQPVLE